MKVWQLIEALKRMPSEMDVSFHANNHSTRPSDTSSVGVFLRYHGNDLLAEVLVGNWGEYTVDCALYHGNHGLPVPTVLCVRDYGDHDGKLVEWTWQERPGAPPSIPFAKTHCETVSNFPVEVERFVREQFPDGKKRAQ